MFKNKTIWIDIGTHEGQEILSYFNFLYRSSKFFKAAIKVIYKKNFLKKLFIFINSIFNFSNYQKLKNIDLVVCEPNTKLIRSECYRFISILYPYAIGPTEEEIKFTNLFFANSNPNGQGSSIYKEKENINQSEFMKVPIINPKTFFELIRNEFNIETSDKIILRLNCEGSEAEIMEYIIKKFPKNRILLCGSLDDIGKIHGKDKLLNFQNYLKKNSILFTEFNENPKTWHRAHEIINKFVSN